MKNKILAYLLTLTMAVTFIPLGFGVSAAEKGAAADAIDQLAQQNQVPPVNVPPQDQPPQE